MEHSKEEKARAGQGRDAGADRSARTPERADKADKGFLGRLKRLGSKARGLCSPPTSRHSASAKEGAGPAAGTGGGAHPGGEHAPELCTLAGTHCDERMFPCSQTSSDSPPLSPHSPPGCSCSPPIGGLLDNHLSSSTSALPTWDVFCTAPSPSQSPRSVHAHSSRSPGSPRAHPSRSPRQIPVEGPRGGIHRRVTGFAGRAASSPTVAAFSCTSSADPRGTARPHGVHSPAAARAAAASCTCTSSASPPSGRRRRASSAGSSSLPQPAHGPPGRRVLQRGRSSPHSLTAANMRAASNNRRSSFSPRQSSQLRFSAEERVAEAQQESPRMVLMGVDEFAEDSESMWNTGSVLSMDSDTDRHDLDSLFTGDDEWRVFKNEAGVSVMQYKKRSVNFSADGFDGGRRQMRRSSCGTYHVLDNSLPAEHHGLSESNESVLSANDEEVELGDEPEMEQPSFFDWKRGGLIGMGSFAHVYMALNCSTGELMAVKQVPIAEEQEELGKELTALMHEIQLLRRLEHPNIVQFLGVERASGMLNVFLEYVSGGSIQHMLKKFGSLPEAVVSRYARQILKGLEYLHEQGIVHRDLKGANCLVHPNGKLKLADFGTAKRRVEAVSAHPTSSLKGTVFWMSPETVRQQPLSEKADIWSLGCTVIEMLTGYPPFSHMDQLPALYHIATLKEAPRFPDGITSLCRSFLADCMSVDPVKRLTARDLLRHPFILSHCVHNPTGKRSRSLSTST